MFDVRCLIRSAAHICSRSKIGDRISKRARRRGQESNLPRHLRGDDGFEDREGHQAPFTLRENANAERPTTNIEHPIEGKDGSDRLLDLFDRADDGVEIRPVAGVEFGMEEFAIGANLESAAA